jgi:hypothetical protein
LDADKFKRIPIKMGPEVFDWYMENKTNIGDWKTFKQEMITKYPAQNVLDL